MSAPAVQSDFRFGPRRLLRKDALFKAVRGDRDLGKRDKSTMRSLVDHLNDQGWAQVDVAAIAHETGYHTRSVRRSTAWLYKQGKLDKVYRWVDGKRVNLPNAYRVYPNLEVLPAPQPTPRPSVPPTAGKVIRYARPKGPEKAPAPPTPARRAPRRTVEKVGSLLEKCVPTASQKPVADRTLHPGGGTDKVSGKDRRNSEVVISEKYHPYSDVGPPRPKAPPTPDPSRREGQEPPLSPIDAVLVALTARLFPSHAPVAHKAVRRLQALGWNHKKIATYLGAAAREKRFSADRAAAPLLCAVWAAEYEHRTTPDKPPPPPTPEPLASREKPEPPAEARAYRDRAREFTDALRRHTAAAPRPRGDGEDSGGEKGPLKK